MASSSTRTIITWERLHWPAFLILLAAGYVPTMKWMVDRWNETDSYSSHGWLVPFVSLWILWQERGRVAKASEQGSTWGFFALLLSILLHLVAGLADVSSISGFTMVAMVVGFVLLKHGWGWAKALWFPLFFLLFMVPLPEFMISGLNFKLKLVAADFAAHLLDLIGLPSIREGSFLYFGEEKLAVGDVCSGLRSLLSLISLGTLYAWLMRSKGLIHVAVIVASIIPAAILGNGLRIFLVSLLVHFLGSEVVFKPLPFGTDLHLLTGAVIFLGAFAILHIISILVETILPRRRTSTGGNGSLSSP